MEQAQTVQRSVAEVVAHHRHEVQIAPAGHIFSESDGAHDVEADDLVRQEEIGELEVVADGGLDLWVDHLEAKNGCHASAGERARASQACCCWLNTGTTR